MSSRRRVPEARRIEPPAARVPPKPFHSPILQPYRERLPARARQRAPSATPAFLEGVGSSVHVSDGQVREVDLVRGETGRGGRRAGAEAAAEEGELVAEGASVLRRHVAGEVPPLRLELVVGPVVAGQAEGAHLGGPREAASAAIGADLERRAGHGSRRSVTDPGHGSQEQSRRGGEQEPLHSWRRAEDERHALEAPQRVEAGEERGEHAREQGLGEDGGARDEAHRPPEGAHVDHVRQDDARAGGRSAAKGRRRAGP